MCLIHIDENDGVELTHKVDVDYSTNGSDEHTY